QQELERGHLGVAAGLHAGDLEDEGADAEHGEPEHEAEDAERDDVDQARDYEYAGDDVDDDVDGAVHWATSRGSYGAAPLYCSMKMVTSELALSVPVKAKVGFMPSGMLWTPMRGPLTT